MFETEIAYIGQPIGEMDVVCAVQSPKRRKFTRFPRCYHAVSTDWHATLPRLSVRSIGSLRKSCPGTDSQTGDRRTSRACHAPTARRYRSLAEQWMNLQRVTSILLGKLGSNTPRSGPRGKTFTAIRSAAACSTMSSTSIQHCAFR